MATQSKIEWTETTWNPVTGCTKISAGCANCYAERMALRLKAMGQARYANGFRVTCHDDVVERPLTWKKPQIIFVNSMGDLFHEDVPFEFIQRVFDTMAKCPQHIFQILTKRSVRLAQTARHLPWPENIWMGVSVENAESIERISALQRVPAVVRFLSCEPLLGELGALPLEGIHWVIVGGESGYGARTMKIEWVNSILTQCQTHHVKFFFKQWGGVRKKRAGRLLHGKTYDNLPESIYQHPASRLFKVA